MGGEGSGRPPNPETIAKAMIGNTGREITQWLPTVGGVKPGAHRSANFTNGSVVFIKNNDLAQDNSNLFWDDTNNRLGIGTTSPDALLDIEGTTTAAQIIKNTGAGAVTLTGDANRTGAGQGLFGIQGYWDGTRVGLINFITGDDTTNKDDGEISFETASAGTTAERMRIDNSGNVGIGTASPLEKLHVSGNLRIGTIATTQTAVSGNV